ncbi:hypothetical protein [Conyzicola sp.]|uniref:hypothetical protein n=1 Tax=Conyzicola sp. TaxID=1969404 RepID=UPI003988F921
MTDALRRAPNVTGRRRILAVVAVMLLCTVSASVGACIALGLATADLANWSQWARDFAKSPGPAALVALVAAAIAYAGLSKQIAVSRESLAHQQRAAQSTSWWSMFEWASGRAVPAVPGEQALPDEITIGTLQRLAEEATTEVQQTACKGMIDFLVTRLAEEASPIGGRMADDGVPDPESPVLAPLQQYVDATAGTAASSAKAEALVYENNVRKALLAEAVHNADLRVFRSPNDDGADAILLVNGRKVLVIVRWQRDERRAHANVMYELGRLRKIADDSPILVVTPFLPPLSENERELLRAVGVQWRTPADGEKLRTAIQWASIL